MRLTRPTSYLNVLLCSTERSFLWLGLQKRSRFSSFSSSLSSSLFVLYLLLVPDVIQHAKSCRMV